MQKLDHQISSLADFLEMGSVLAEDDYSLIQRGYRFIVVNPYLVFYRVIKETVIIHRILHGRRDYLRELFGSFE
ncbi:type II toxin-antitoxin system RelE/ParE family toxin [Paenibacillus oenotherae]|uniref:Type II toxin-antitoxin system RelE/ParE family toxin n=1 Tax=Paenibacillus oenotherae TaxID=1435645 RepID=A0ABS7D958_9BACL|nr:type II toxin-antitoxin system RelE/ParE family toxin [Paenibacillus oenotherae]